MKTKFPLRCVTRHALLAALTAATALALSAVTSHANLLANPGFEAGLDGWTCFENYSRSSTNRSGSYSLAISGTGAGSFNVSGAYQILPASPGQRWTLSGYGRNDPGNPLSGNDYALFKIVWFDGPDGTGNQLQPLPGTGAVFGQNPGIESAPLDYSSPQTDWVPLSASGVAPEGTRSVQLLGGLFIQLNEASGTALIDDLTAAITTEWNNALSFDGLDDYVVFDRPVSDDFTLECWMRSTNRLYADANWWQGMGLIDGEVTGPVGDFGLSLGAGRVLFGTGGTNDLTIRSEPVADGRWHHVAATRERATGIMRLYVDGWCVATGTNGTQSLSAPALMRLGSLAKGIDFFQGEMDDVRIWSVVRSQAEIQACLGRPLTGREANLAAYWNLDEGSGGTAYDATGHAHDGAVTNWAGWVASTVTRNLALNPGFDDGTTGWGGFGWASVEPASGLPPGGSACARVFNRTNNFSGISQSFLGAFQTNIEYHVSAWVRLQNATSAPVALTFQKTDGTVTTFQWVAGGTATSNAWTQLSGHYTLTVTGALNGLTLYLEGPNAFTNYYADDFVVEPVTPLGTIDTTVTHQTIAGFGGSLAFYNNWLTAHPYAQEIYTNLFSGLNLSLLRIGNWFRYTNAFDYDTAAIVSNANRILGRPLTLEMSSWSPPAFLKNNGKTTDGGSLIWTNGGFAYTNFANYWYDSLLCCQSNGVVPTYISVQNEPDFRTPDWDTCELFPIEIGTNYASYALALEATSRRLTNLPAPPRILAPEIVGLGYHGVQSYADTLDPDIVYGVAHHLYHGGDPNHPDSFSSDMQRLASVFPDKPRWQTEFGNGDMIQTALLIHNSLTIEEVSAYLFWSLVWPKAPPDVSGPALVQQEYPWNQSRWTNAPPGCPTQSKGYWLTAQYYAMKQFSYFIEPGYRRVDTPGTDSHIRLSAYLAPDNRRLVVVLINPNNTPYEGTLNLNSFEVGASAVYQTVGTNAETSQFAPLGAMPTDLHGTLPGYSITTIVFEPRYGAAHLTNLPPTSLFTDTATLNGTVDPAGQDTVAWYEWGTTTAYGNSTTPVPIASGTNWVPVGALLSGLDPNLTCHYRLVASNRLGVAYGPDQVFSFPIVYLNGPNPLTNECHVPAVDPGAFTRRPAIAAGWTHSLALQADRTVVGWGQNTYGQTNIPASASNAVAIAAGENHNLALRADGAVVGWGLNSNGQANGIPHVGSGKALAFDGTDDYVRADQVTLTNTSFTIEAWARRDTTGTMDMIVAQGSGQAHRGLMFGFHWDWVGFVFDFYGDGVTSLNIDNAWHHWAGTYDASTSVQCLYRDGVLLATNVAAQPYQGSGQLYIGREPFDNPACFAGAIDEVRIWNVARSQAEIQADLGHPLTGAEANLIAYWKFDENGGNTAYDSTTNGHNGTLFNGPVWTDLNVAAIAAGYTHSLALLPNRTVFGWGDNSYGCVSIPRMASNAVSIAAGHDYSLALRADGTVVGWGSDPSGQATGMPNPGLSNALSFDGSDDYLVVTNFGGAVPTNEVTVEFWQRVHAVKSQATFSLDPDQLDNRFQAHVPFNNGYVFWDFGNIAGDGRLAYLPPETLLNSWQHFAMVAKAGAGGYMKIYRNGVLEASKTNAGSPHFTTHNLKMAPGFDGELDEFRIWNVARSQEEIQANLAHALTGSEPNLVACWKFDETNGTVAFDSSPHGYQAAFIGAPVRTNLPTPCFGMVSVAGQPLTNVAAISAGEWHGMALRNDGTVVCWGYNNHGQANSPANNSNFVAISAGSRHSLALRADGTVAAWGAGTTIGSAPHYGQSMVPAEATNIVAIAAGGRHSLALRADGKVLGWGAGTDNTGTNFSFGQAIIPDALVMPAGLSLSDPVISASGIDINNPGTNLWIYAATNTLGAVGTATRTVYVVDTTPPVLTLLGANPLVHPYHAAFVDPGAVAADACGGYLPVTVVTNTVNPEVLGTYGVTYGAADAAGNSATINRTVLVQTAPSFLPGDLDNNGVLDQAEFDAVARNYWGPASRPCLTNPITDGQGNWQVSLTNAAAWNFGVEVSTNLVDWEYLGPAWPSLQFFDPQATNQPQRFYRLTWP